MGSRAGSRRSATWERRPGARVVACCGRATIIRGVLRVSPEWNTQLCEVVNNCAGALQWVSGLWKSRKLEDLGAAIGFSLKTGCLWQWRVQIWFGTPLLRLGPRTAGGLARGGYDETFPYLPCGGGTAGVGPDRALRDGGGPDVPVAPHREPGVVELSRFRRAGDGAAVPVGALRQRGRMGSDVSGLTF